MGTASGNARKEPPFAGEGDPGGGVAVRRDVGTGRSIVIIDCPAANPNKLNNRANTLSEALSGSLRVVELEVQPPASGAEWRLIAREIEEQLSRLGIRLCTVVGVGEGTVIAQHLAISHPKLCQSLVLVNPVFQLSETLLSRLAAWVESALPLGLPLRIGSDQFVSAPFLHRLRCPTLVLVSTEISAAAARVMVSMARRIPNAWYQMLTAEKTDEQLIHLVQTFLPVRNRHPMRRAAG